MQIRFSGVNGPNQRYIVSEYWIIGQEKLFIGILMSLFIYGNDTIIPLLGNIWLTYSHDCFFSLKYIKALKLFWTLSPILWSNWLEADLMPYIYLDKWTT